MLAEYLFVFSHRENEFPERWRILGESDAAAICDADELTGTVPKAEVETLREEFAKRHPSFHFTVSRAWASSWKAIARSFRGMDYEQD